MKKCLVISLRDIIGHQYQCIHTTCVLNAEDSCNANIIIPICVHFPAWDPLWFNVVKVSDRTASVKWCVAFESVRPSYIEERSLMPKCNTCFIEVYISSVHRHAKPHPDFDGWEVPRVVEVWEICHQEDISPFIGIPWCDLKINRSSQWIYMAKMFLFGFSNLIITKICPRQSDTCRTTLWPLYLLWAHVVVQGDGVQASAHLWPNTQIAKFMGPTWGPPGPCRPQMGPMLAPRTLLSGSLSVGYISTWLTASLNSHKYLPLGMFCKIGHYSWYCRSFDHLSEHLW